MPIQIANEHDIPGLESLLNSAYRGDGSKKGWTSEADLISGELRTDASTLRDLFKTPGAVFLKHSSDAMTIDGCVFLHQIAQRLYLGMLSVSPLIQAKGIGKLLLAAAEERAKRLGCQAIFMKVISARTELIQWYERKGYSRTGETEPFPTDGRFGKPTQALEFIILEKKL
jgi:GNAT superfamily N-acetyltransferase